jgi:hypothetical protein
MFRQLFTASDELLPQEFVDRFTMLKGAGTIDMG